MTGVHNLILYKIQLKEVPYNMFSSSPLQELLQRNRSSYVYFPLSLKVYAETIVSLGDLNVSNPSMPEYELSSLKLPHSSAELSSSSPFDAGTCNPIVGTANGSPVK
jgi:hypothetical protein